MKTIGDLFWLVWLIGYFPVFAILLLINADAILTAAVLVAWSLAIAALGSAVTFLYQAFFD